MPDTVDKLWGYDTISLFSKRICKFHHCHLNPYIALLTCPCNDGQWTRVQIKPNFGVMRWALLVIVALPLLVWIWKCSEFHGEMGGCAFLRFLGSLRGLDYKIVLFPNRVFPPIWGFVVLTSPWNPYFNFKGKAKCRRGLGTIRWIALYVDTYARMFHFMWWDNLNQTSGNPASHQSKQILRFSCEPNVFIAPDFFNIML